MRNACSRALLGALSVVVFAGCSGSAPAPGAAAAAVTASLPGGTPIAVDLTAPADGALVASPPGDVHLAGTVSIGDGEKRPDTALVYLLDATAAAAGAATCGAATTVLACERAALSDLNARAIALGTVGHVGAAFFAGGGAALDVAPAAGVQPRAAPGADADAAGGPDVLEALASVKTDGTASRFSPITIGTGPAQVGAGLQAAFGIAAASAEPARMVILLSASTSAAGPAASAIVAPPGTLVRAFALPGTTCAAGLADFAARGAEGSGCEDVADLTTLSGRVAAAITATLVSLELTVDAGPPVPLVAGALPAEAPYTAPFQAAITALAPGAHRLCVRAAGTDAGGAGTAVACAVVKVATIAVAPLEATHELGTPGQTATVTATVAAGEAGGVAEVPVTFAVKSGPNAGKGATVATDAEGRAAFTYEARQHLEGLGTDALEACFADSEGTQACATATVIWQDTTPPVVACAPGPNPAGHVVSRGAAVGPSGFMTLLAEDAVDPVPLVFLLDTGSGTAWGPFPSGEHVKYTQAPGARPSGREMGSDEGGGIELLHVTGKGDPALRGEDAAGNESAPKACPVPPGKK